MVRPTDDFDAVVLGGGTAGAGAAYHLAIRGLRVALVERRGFGDAGARWVNAIPPWQFDRAGIALPTGDELVGADFMVHLLDREGVERVRLGRSPIWNVDMRLLVARLQGLAADAGATMMDHTSLVDLHFDRDRPVAMRVRSAPPSGKSPSDRELRAKLFVDAAGLGGALRDRVPELARHCPAVEPADICHAAQQVRRIDDRDAAHAFLERVAATTDDALNFVGIEGGFSTLTVKVHETVGTFEILAGSIDDGQHKNGYQLIDDFVAAEPWVGEVIFGGAGRIPLRRPYARQAAPGIALVGNAGCQVFPAHGSGIGSGLIAGRILAEAVAGHGDPGSLEATWAYQAAFMREIGSVHAAYDLFRRLSQTMDSRKIANLLASGLMTEASSRAALTQEIPRFDAGTLSSMVGAALRHPALTAQFAPTVARMNSLYLLYREYPRTPSLRRLRVWERVAAGIGRHARDLA